MSQALSIQFLFPVKRNLEVILIKCPHFAETKRKSQRSEMLSPMSWDLFTSQPQALGVLVQVLLQPVPKSKHKMWKTNAWFSEVVAFLGRNYDDWVIFIIKWAWDTSFSLKHSNNGNLSWLSSPVRTRSSFSKWCMECTTHRLFSTLTYEFSFYFCFSLSKTQSHFLFHPLS